MLLGHCYLPKARQAIRSLKLSKSTIRYRIRTYTKACWPFRTSNNCILIPRFIKRL